MRLMCCFTNQVISGKLRTDDTTSYRDGLAWKIQYRFSVSEYPSSRLNSSCDIVEDEDFEFPSALPPLEDRRLGGPARRLVWGVFRFLGRPFDARDGAFFGFFVATTGSPS